MRRWLFAICILLLLSACGRRAQVSVPLVHSTSSSAATVNGPAPSSELEGMASFYAEPYNGRKTANGETFDTYKEMTAAHRTLPFNTVVRVTNKNNGQSVDVRINDRGPFVDGRVIDLSLFAAQKIDMVRAGVVPVKLAVLKQTDPVVPVVTRPTAVIPSAALPPAGTPIYTVQVGAFEDRQAAEALKKRLEKKFSGVSIQTFSGSATVYRVRIGSESDMQAAQKLASLLRKDSLSPFVVRVN